MRTSLAESLRYLHTTAGAQLGLRDEDVAATADHILSHRVRPGVFGRYYKLALAVENDDPAEARRQFDGLATLARHPASLSVFSFDKDHLGGEKELYGELIDQTRSPIPWVLAPRPEQGTQLSENVQQALTYLSSLDKDLAGEI